MRSSRLITFSFAAIMFVSLRAQAWGWNDHRTYHGSVIQEPYQPYHPFEPYRAYEPIYHRETYRPIYSNYRYSAPSAYWRTGHWQHSWHENRFGWWWVNGVAWNFYSAPVYPYPEQTQTKIIYEPAPQPAPQNLGPYYFCESSQLYYPYARTCSERWKTVSQAPVD